MCINSKEVSLDSLQKYRLFPSEHIYNSNIIWKLETIMDIFTGKYLENKRMICGILKWKPVAASCKHGNKSSGSMKQGFLD